MMTVPGRMQSLWRGWDHFYILIEIKTLHKKMMAVPKNEY
jgi:hypothetical protein